jgi:hypothetical protein
MVFEESEELQTVNKQTNKQANKYTSQVSYMENKLISLIFNRRFIMKLTSYFFIFS